MNQGRIEALHIIAAAGKSPTAVDAVHAVTGQGLEGDRYATGEGIKPGNVGGKRAATLIEAETVEALDRDYEIRIAPGESRRNITTRGVELCEPCNYLESLTQPGVRAGFVHRGGLRAEILESGMIKIGDAIHG